MNRYRFLLLLATALALASCVAQPQQLDNLIRAVTAVASDDVVTPAELQIIQSQLPQPGFDWMRLVEAGGVIVGAITGVKLIPDRHLRSPFDPAQPSQPPQ